jgi:rhamnogalacturonyl hydrolase YesR
MDVDTVHHSTLTPERTGGQRTIWSQFHHYTDTGRTELVTPRTSHVWFGGLIDFYHITGYRRALEVAGLTGRYCAGTRSRVGWDSMPADFRDRWDDPRFDMTVEGYPDWYSPRRAGWALTGIADLYEVNRDPTLADEMAAMVTVLSRWQDADGRWRSRFGAFARATEVFMVASILYGLERVWELTGNEKAKELLIRGCRFIATVTVTREGLMYYKEAPINAGPGSANILAFRPMVFAYRETGDAAILRAMWRQFRWMIEQGGPRGWEVKDALWALPLFREQGLLERWRDDGV